MCERERYLVERWVNIQAVNAPDSNIFIIDAIAGSIPSDGKSFFL